MFLIFRPSQRLAIPEESTPRPSKLAVLIQPNQGPLYQGKKLRVYLVNEGVAGQGGSCGVAKARDDVEHTRGNASLKRKLPCPQSCQRGLLSHLQKTTAICSAHAKDNQTQKLQPTGREAS